ncbi:unnamed protein product [Strongylus vulgaris]|uniref:Uncharacterized protein n=1 Tax=Strongylus vulgaris TaxID=40348 RepID=A0A3P7IB97_STRVU|nr:unnamed protein product [Strongylus vulgaris]
MVRHLSEHPLFERLTKEEEEADPVVPLLFERYSRFLGVYQSALQLSGLGGGTIPALSQGSMVKVQSLYGNAVFLSSILN